MEYEFACWIVKATDTHSQYVIFIALPLQQWIRERALILRYAYLACLFRVLVLANTLELARTEWFSVILKTSVL
jgi:hypothetical protein